MNFIKLSRARIISILLLLLMLATLITMIPDAVEPIEVFAETVDYYELKVGEDVVGRFEKEADAQDVIDQVINNYVDQGQDVVDVKVTPAMAVEKVTVEKEKQPELQANTGAVIQTLLEGNQEKGAYIVQEGDTLWGIAENNDMSIEELEQVNPDLNMEVINVGDEINVCEVQYLVDVTVEYEVESEEVVPFETVYEDSANMYVDDPELVYVEGVEGSKKVVSRVVEVNGVITQQTEVSSEVLTEPTTQVIVRGTAERPAAEPATQETTTETQNTNQAAETTPEPAVVETPAEPAPEPEPEPTPEPEPEPVQQTVQNTGSSASRDAIVNYALSYCGSPYVWGGISLTNGCDCSGFVYSVFNNNGYNIARWPDDDYPHVSASELRPGDVVRYEGHYSIYIGNGMEVSALNESRGVCTHPMYYSRWPFWYGIRIIND